VVSVNEGSLVAWFECAGTDRRATLVVYDTASQRTMVRRHLALCDRGPRDSCTLYGLTRDRVYFNHGIYQLEPHPEYTFDVSAGQLSESTTRMYDEDIRAQSRGLVIGDTWQTGTPTDGLGQNFKVVGSRLVAGDLEVTAKAFDTATGQAVRLRLPPGYQAKSGEGFGLFEWLDDDTVALIATDTEGHNGDILTCDLPDGPCAVAVEESQNQGQEENPRRLVPSGPLPG
jgi:hypothetical protein